MSSAIPSAADVIDRIVAVVNGSIITLSDLHAAQRFGLVPDVSGDWRQQVRERLIERRLMLAEVERYGPPPPAAGALEAAVAASRARFASEEAFDAALRETGLTREELRRQHRDALRLDTYLRQRFGSPVQGDAVREWIAGLRRRADVSILPLR